MRKRVPDLVGGFSPTKVGDNWGLRIVDFGGAWPSPKSPGFKRLSQEIEQIARELDITVDVWDSRFDATIVGNSWTEAPDGRGYLSRLVSRGRTDLSGALARAAPERDAWVADAWARAQSQPATGAAAAAGFVGGRGTAGDVLRQSFGAGNNALAIAARGTVGYLQAKLEGKSDEEALAEALTLMAPGVASRAAMRVATAASATSALDAIPSAIDARLPDYSSAHILDLPPLEPRPLSRIDELANVVRRVFGLPEEDPIATTAMRARERLKNVVDSQANREGATIGAIVRDAFEMDEHGRIVTLPGHPTIQDAAAKLPFMEPFMTPRQRLVMMQLREHIEP